MRSSRPGHEPVTIVGSEYSDLTARLNYVEEVRLQRQLAIIRRQEHASQALLRRMEAEVAQLCAQTSDQTYLRPGLDDYLRQRVVDSSVSHILRPDYVTNHRRPRFHHSTTLSSSAPPLSGGSTQQDAVDVVMQHQQLQRQRRRRRKSDEDARRLMRQQQSLPRRLPALDISRRDAAGTIRPTAGRRADAGDTTDEVT